MLRNSACDSSDGIRNRLFDVCIVGGGAAGITLAMELRASALSVCVLEGGSLSTQPISQGLYRGLVDGVYAHDLDECRARWLGGSTNYWPGTCTPLDALDFECRDWIPDSEWPFGHDELASYYPLAADYCSLRSTSFRPDANETPPAHTLDAAVWTTRRAQVSTSPRFAERFEPMLGEAENVTVVLGANVVRIACAPSGTRVDHVVVQPFGQPSFTVRSKAFVLAMGGLENARLLLVSNDVHARGIGNERDLVGRFFMDHPVIHSILLEASPSSALDWYAAIPAGAIAQTNYLQLQESFVRSERATNVRVHFTPASDVEMTPAMFSYSYLRLCQRRRRRPHLPLQQLARIASGMDLLGAYLASRATGNAGSASVPRNDRLRVSIMCEQVPHAANCAALSSGRDALGLPRLHLRWRMLEEEQRRARWAIDLLADSVRAAGLGRIRNLCADPAQPFEERLGFGNHAIGTTRASVNARTGVVDGDGRVFGVDNLFIAGSSVFPTSSHLPPTLTIVALAIRMAAHLTERADVSRKRTPINSQRE